MCVGTGSSDCQVTRAYLWCVLEQVHTGHQGLLVMCIGTGSFFPQVTRVYLWCVLEQAPSTVRSPGIICDVFVEQDTENEKNLPLEEVSIDDILDMQREMQIAKEQDEERKRKALQERGMHFTEQPEDFMWWGENEAFIDLHY